MPSEDFYGAMRYLRLVRRNLEDAEAVTHSLDQASPAAEDTDDDDETSSFSSLSCTSSPSHSRSSLISTLTTPSDVFLEAYIAHTDPHSNDDEILDLRGSIIFIARRVTCQRFAEELGHAFRGTRLAFARAIRIVLANLNLRYCEVSEKLHVFEEGRRCHRCDVQLCRDCEQCILKHCTSILGSLEILGESQLDKENPISPTNVELLAAELEVEPMPLSRPSPPRINTDWQLRDSLAAKRIGTNCHRDICNWHIISADPCDFNTCFLHAKHPFLCQCTEFLVKPSHSCEKGEFHFCKECYHMVAYAMGLPNMKTVAFRTKIGGEVSLTQYTCPSGYPSPEYIPAICRICHGTCTRPVLNDLSSPYKVNGGGEGKSPRWNNAACPWIFSLIPGVDESFVTSSGKRRRGMSRDLMSKLDRERKDDWALLFAT